MRKECYTNTQLQFQQKDCACVRPSVRPFSLTSYNGCRRMSPCHRSKVIDFQIPWNFAKKRSLAREKYSHAWTQVMFRVLSNPQKHGKGSLKLSPLSSSTPFVHKHGLNELSWPKVLSIQKCGPSRQFGGLHLAQSFQFQTRLHSWMLFLEWAMGVFLLWHQN